MYGFSCFAGNYLWCPPNASDEGPKVSCMIMLAPSGEKKKNWCYGSQPFEMQGQRTIWIGESSCLVEFWESPCMEVLPPLWTLHCCLAASFPWYLIGFFLIANISVVPHRAPSSLHPPTGWIQPCPWAGITSPSQAVHTTCMVSCILQQCSWETSESDTLLPLHVFFYRPSSKSAPKLVRDIWIY